MAVEVVGEYGLGLATVIVESVIAFLLYRTVKDYAEVGKASRIEAQQRFRPWVGPSGAIEFIRVLSGRHQFSVPVKNYGEIPATAVIAMSAASLELPTRDMVKDDQLDKFNLGPLLPNMEKRYWIFISSEMIEEAIKENLSIYTTIHFIYEFGEGSKSGYGMISQLDPKSNSFVHKDMWVEQRI